MRITKDTVIRDALTYNINIAPFFMEIGMRNLGHPSAASETIEEACAVYNTDCDALVEKINGYLDRQ